MEDAAVSPRRDFRLGGLGVAPGQGPCSWRWTRPGNICSPRRLSAQAVFDVCTKRAAEAGIARFSPHDMRRTYISSLLDAGADIAIVQRLVGHADPSTTSSYDRRPDEAKRKTAELLSIPFPGQTRSSR